MGCSAGQLASGLVGEGVPVTSARVLRARVVSEGVSTACCPSCLYIAFSFA